MSDKDAKDSRIARDYPQLVKPLKQRNQAAEPKPDARVTVKWVPQKPQ